MDHNIYLLKINIKLIKYRLYNIVNNNTIFDYIQSHLTCEENVIFLISNICDF